MATVKATIVEFGKTSGGPYVVVRVDDGTDCAEFTVRVGAEGVDVPSSVEWVTSGWRGEKVRGQNHPSGVKSVAWYKEARKSVVEFAQLQYLAHRKGGALELLRWRASLLRLQQEEAMEFALGWARQAEGLKDVESFNAMLDGSPLSRATRLHDEWSRAWDAYTNACDLMHQSSDYGHHGQARRDNDRGDWAVCYGKP